MTTQNFFYITSSSAIIILSLLFVVLIILGIVIAVRIAKTFRNVSHASEQISKTAKELREKLKVSALIGTFMEGLKEIILLVREKRVNSKEKKK
ncbi:hypothetical protein L6278_01075, partial [Candidatus Parcubacteria bacterium]|nr:hypothetical protein [Patescibacteria group bacterium]MCG2686711.1 hypothetical protein [Candidatus Parcubacteria bacterium]